MRASGRGRGDGTRVGVLSGGNSGGGRSLFRGELLREDRANRRSTEGRTGRDAFRGPGVVGGPEPEDR